MFSKKKEMVALQCNITALLNQLICKIQVLNMILQSTKIQSSIRIFQVFNDRIHMNLSIKLLRMYLFNVVTHTGITDLKTFLFKDRLQEGLANDKVFSILLKSLFNLRMSLTTSHLHSLLQWSQHSNQVQLQKDQVDTKMKIFFVQFLLF